MKHVPGEQLVFDEHEVLQREIKESKRRQLNSDKNSRRVLLLFHSFSNRSLALLIELFL